MVEVTEIIEDPEPEPEPKTEIPQSQERLLDADEIESFYLPKSTNDNSSKNVNIRPSVKAHLESLVQKIRRDAKALKRMEDSTKRQELEKQKEDQDQPQAQVHVQEEIKKQVQKEEEEVQKEKVVVEKTNDTIEEPTAPTCVFPTPTINKYKSIDKFAFDAGTYDSPTVTIYITSLPDNKTISSLSLSKEDVSCDFTSSSFDLKIVSHVNANNANNVNYRLIKDNLEKEINPEKSKFILKSNKIIIKLYKIKGEYGSFESWTNLTDTKKGSSSTGNGNSNGSKKKSNDPSASIMDMMKEMYDSGDDNMKKMIGETMMKQRDGTLGDGKGGMGGMGMDGMGM